ncbi:unnamed protein product [Cyprideis torosa]|uniref:Uncharacterized protein n=1 Tax=Cyprideis torosa TaxID=163714 RepID=A0A7R8ZSW4_9CRUS|nr:unnamed protein product [Cyprideis torosa]CAG0896523.1 unnamed protein product [Cyprideis torosa]
MLPSVSGVFHLLSSSLLPLLRARRCLPLPPSLRSFPPEEEGTPSSSKGSSVSPESRWSRTQALSRATTIIRQLPLLHVVGRADPPSTNHNPPRKQLIIS